MDILIALSLVFIGFADAFGGAVGMGATAAAYLMMPPPAGEDRRAIRRALERIARSLEQMRDVWEKKQ
jgi:hypothetical protein